MKVWLVSRTEQGGFISYMMLFLGMATVGMWAAWQSTMGISYQSMVDEYRLVRCQYGIERGIVLGTQSEYFQERQYEITGGGSPVYVLEEEDGERIEAIYYKEREDRYCLRVMCIHVESESNVKKDVYIKPIYKDTKVERIEILKIN